MAPFVEAITLIIHTLLYLYLLIVLLRFLLQVARADFYNPISQFIVKATNPLIKPLRKLIPGLAGLDLASLTLAIVIQLISIWSVAALHGAGFFDPLTAILWAAVGTVSFIINIYFFGLIIMVIASWIAPGSYHPALILVNQLIEPLMKPIRRVIPPLGGIDLSPIFAFLLLQIFRIFINYVPVDPRLVLGA